MKFAFFLIPAVLLAQAAVDFQKDVKPIFEESCVECHQAGKQKADLDMSSRRDLLDHRSIVPGKPDKSVLYTMMRDGLMPPGEKLSAQKLAIVRQWIQEGAPWPEGVALEAPKKAAPPSGQQTQNAEAANVRDIRQRIVTREKTASQDGAYTVTIPQTTVSYGMAPIPAGDFLMGSPDSDPQHKKDEQPQHKVHVDAFWMQVHEVTWDEYRLFMFANQAGEIAHKDEVVDGVSLLDAPVRRNELRYGHQWLSGNQHDSACG